MTTSPAARVPLTIGLVVIRSPSENLGEPLILPVTDPSLFLRHLVMVGTPRGAVFFTVAVAFALSSSSSDDPPNPPSPNKEIVDRGFALLIASSASFALRSRCALVSAIVDPGFAAATSLNAANLLTTVRFESALRK